MSRKIHDLTVHGDMAAAIVETAASGGGRWESRVQLSTLRLPVKEIESLSDRRIRGNGKFQEIESWTVNGSSRGPSSKFARTLEAMKEELPGHLDGHGVRVVTAAMEISPERLQEVAGRARAAWSEHQLRAALPESGAWAPHAEEPRAIATRLTGNAEVEQGLMRGPGRSREGRVRF